MKKIIAALIAGAFATAAYAEENPLRFDVAACSLDAYGTLGLQTLPTPKGWFTSKGAFDRKKTDIRAAYSLSSSSCDNGAAAGSMSSITIGTLFTAVLNPQSKDIGYIWNMVGDLSANQNHWWYFTGCDGVQVKVGCDQARTATFTITAFGQDGQCRTYVNSAGVTTCATDTIELTLASVHDEDLTIDAALCQPADVSCGIGQCVSERVNAGGFCERTYPVKMELDPKNKAKEPQYYDVNAGARRDCVAGASCFCKSQLPAACQNNGNDCQ